MKQNLLMKLYKIREGRVVKYDGQSEITWDSLPSTVWCTMEKIQKVYCLTSLGSCLSPHNGIRS
jgi:hypothetical protein